MEKQKEWLSPDEVVEEYGIAKSTQALYRAESKIPHSKLGRKVLYSRQKLDEWLQSLEMKS